MPRRREPDSVPMTMEQRLNVAARVMLAAAERLLAKREAADAATEHEQRDQRTDEK